MTSYLYFLVVCLVVSTTTGLPHFAIKSTVEDGVYSPSEDGSSLIEGDFSSNTVDEEPFSSVEEPNFTVEVIESVDTEALPRIEKSSARQSDSEDSVESIQLLHKQFPSIDTSKKHVTVEESMRIIEEYKASFIPYYEEARRKIQEKEDQERKEREEQEREEREEQEREEREEREEQEREEELVHDYLLEETEGRLAHQDIYDGQDIDSTSIAPQDTVIVLIDAEDREIGDEEVTEGVSIEDIEEREAMYQVKDDEFVPESVEDIKESEARYLHQVISVVNPKDNVIDVGTAELTKDSEARIEHSDGSIEETKFSAPYVGVSVEDIIEAEELPYFGSVDDVVEAEVEDIAARSSQSDELEVKAEKDEATFPSFDESRIDDALSTDTKVFYRSELDEESDPSAFEESHGQIGEAEDSISRFDGKSITDEEDEKTNFAIRLPKHSRVFISPDEPEFDCSGRKIGMYADRRLGCRVVHVCHPFTSYFGFMSRKVFSFVCDDGTVFDQRTQTCSKIDIALPCINSTEFFEFQNKVDGIFIKLLQPLKTILSLKSQLTQRATPTPVEIETNPSPPVATTPKPQMFTMVPLRFAEEKNDDRPSSAFSNYTPLKTTSALIRKTKLEIENKIAKLAQTLSSLKNEIKKEEEVVTEAIPITDVSGDEDIATTTEDIDYI